MTAPSIIQLNILDGSAQEEGPYTHIQVLPYEEGPAYLFLLLEATGPAPADACRIAIETFQLAFEEGRQSLTGRLTEALRTVHEALLQENLHTSPEHRTTVGAVCAYLRGEDLYLAHAGPALACVIGPQGSRHLAPSPGSPASSLGALQEPSIWIRHHRLLPEERLLLASSQLVYRGGEQGLLTAFRERLEAGMAEVYRRAYGSETFAALAVDPAGLALPEAGRTPPNRQATVDRVSPLGRATAYGAGRQQPSNLPVALPEPYLIRDSALPLSLDVSAPRRWASRYATGLLPPQVRTALLGLFLIGGLFLGLRSILLHTELEAQAQASALVQSATQLRIQAQGASSGDMARQLLTEALNQLKTAQQRDPASSAATPLMALIQDTLTRMDAIQELRDVRTVLDLNEPPEGPALLRNVFLKNDTLYVLDKAGDQIVQVPSPNPQGGGASSGPFFLPQGRGSSRRNLDSLALLPSGGGWPQDSLLTVDDNRGLLEFIPGQEPRSLPLRGTGEWASFQAAEGFAGSLYILDPKASQVWRYLPTDRGFDSERRAMLPSLDLRDAVDLAVDGDVYVLVRTGKVLKFSSGRAQPFSMDGLDKPMLNPVSLFSNPASKAVYVSDAGNKRILAFEKETGKFLRQFPVPQLPQIHCLWVDEERSIIYLVADTRLYSATMPRS